MVETTAYSLKGYQVEGVRQLRAFNGRAILADDMGLGKTAQALYYLHHHGAFPAIVVTQASCKTNWEREVAIWAPGRRVIQFQGTKPPAKGGLTTSDFYVINYDILKQWERHLGSLAPQSMVLDESHFLKDPNTIRTQVITRLSKRMASVICLSGSPVLNRPSDLFCQLRIVRPDVFNSFPAFGERYCQPRLRPWGWEYKGATNLLELHQELKRTCLIRRLKSQVGDDLPEKIRRVIPVPIPDMSDYKRATQKYLVWLKEQQRAGAVAKAEKAVKLTQTGELLRLAAQLKLRGCVDWINNHLTETSEKLLVFAEHKGAVDVLHRRLNGNPLRIDGGTPSHHRQAIVDAYQTNPAHRVMVCSRAGNTGLNITAASVVVFVEFWWRPSDHTQAEDRAHRIGQTRPVWCYYLVAAGTLEEKLCQLIQEKQRVANSILDGYQETNTVDILDELITELELSANV